MTTQGLLAAGALALACGGVAAQSTVVGPIKRLDDTGVAKCVVDGVYTRECADTGQDGEFGRDANARSSTDGRAGFRFTRVCSSGEDEGTGSCPVAPVVGTGHDDWACTRDRVTGLLWEIKQSDGSIRDQHELVSMANWGWGFTTVTELRAAMNGASVCGSTAWDAATLTEMLSLLDFGITGTVKIDVHFFPNTPTNHGYGVPYPRNEPDEGNYAGVNFIRGTGDGAYPGDGTYVRLVTRPQQFTGARYAISADGAQAVDRWTRLVWQRCPVGMHYAAGKCVGEPARLTWDAALAAANAQPGWRLPNIKELVSLASLDDGKLDGHAFLGLTSAALWSSTPFAGGIGSAWEATFDGYGTGWYPVGTDTINAAFLVRDR